MLLALRHFPAGTQGQTYWVHLDGRGSVAGITKHQGQSTHNYRYDAYGQLLPAQGNWADPHNHYTFAGKEWDEHLGLYEFGVRLYDPWAGVWLTREPMPGEAWEPRTWHRYQYAYASPISYYDPYGQQAGGIGGCGLFAVPGIGATGCLYIVVDQHGQVGLAIVEGGGGYMPYGAGAGFSILASDISDIQELAGWSVAVGGSVTFPYKGVPIYVGPDIAVWSLPDERLRWALDINVGIGIMVFKDLPALPVEFHGYLLHTSVRYLFTLPHPTCYQEEKQEPLYWPDWPHYGSPP